VRRLEVLDAWGRLGSDTAVAMKWNLAHKPAGTEDVTFVDVTANNSREAIETLRRQIPTSHVILYVREIFEDDDPAATADLTPGQDWSAE
jgi:hypothetical protein